MNRREIQWIVLFLVLGGGGLAFFTRFYDEAFPVASLDFKLSREEAFQKARDYLEGLGYSTEEYRDAQVFSQDQMQQIFLERTIGLEEANRLAREWVSIWRWRVRWFKPLEKEELQVGLDPGGRIVSFSHSILESDEGANLSQEAALAIAEGFLRETHGFDLKGYELIERSSVERKARADHTFTYRKGAFTVGDDGHYRLGVVVQGSRVGWFAEYLKVPEAFIRSYGEVRSRAALLSKVAMVFWLALGIAMLVVLVQKYRQRGLRWGTGLTIGGLVAVAYVIARVNALPLIRFGYVTTQSYGVFIVSILFFGGISAFLTGGIICLTGVSGEALGREVLFAGRRSPFGRLSFRRIFSGGFVCSTFVGYGLAFAFLGFVTLFYIVGSRYFGVWSPAWMVDYDNAFSTAIPWIYPLLVGLTASTMEEFFFRMLAIPLLIRWLKRRWLAVLLPAVVWGFLHSNYPVEPIWTRGIEVSLVGIVFGLVFLRYGIWAPLIAHYAIDAFMVAFPMMKSSSLYFQVSGMLVTGVLFLPAVLALVGVLTGRYRQVEKEEGGGVPEPVPVTPPSEASLQEEAPGGRRLDAYLLGRHGQIIAGAFAAVGIALLAGLDVQPFGKRTLSLSVTREEAIRLAEGFRQEVGVRVEGYRRTAAFREWLGSREFVYLIRKAGVGRADTLATQESGPWSWYVRWFKPLEKEEATVVVYDPLRIGKFEHKIPEGQAGAKLEEGAARAIAEAFVERRFHRQVTDTLRYRLLEARSEKREARMDHEFVWERIDRKVEDGEFRIEATVQGDEIGLVRHRYRAPEAFLRKISEQKIKDLIPIVVVFALVIATVILAGRSFFQAYRAREMRWGFPVRIGILTAVFKLIGDINGLPDFFYDYDTSQPLGIFLGIQAIGFLLGVGFTGLGVTVLMALVQALFERFHPGEMGPARWFGILRLREGGGRLWWDILLLGAALELAVEGIGRFKGFVSHRWLTDYLKPEGLAPSGLNTYLPFLGGLTDAVLGALVLPFLALAAVLVWQQTLKRKRTLLILFGVTAVLMGAVAPAEDLFHFAFLLGLNLIWVAAIVYLVGWVVRFNLLAYVVAFWARDLIPLGWAYMQPSIAFYQANGAAMLLLGIGPLALPMIAYLKARRSPSSPAGV